MSEHFDDMKKKFPTFFLGANSADGFKSCFSNVCDREKGELLYIIKGGPGTGKSTLMKNIANKLIDKGEDPEIILCSSDIDSLDGVVFPKIGVSIVDGTAPHVVEPKYIGVTERVIQLSEYLDNSLLKKEEENIISLYKTNSSLHKKASDFISGAGELLEDNFTIDCACSNLKDVAGAAKSTAELFLKDNPTKSVERIRFLSGITTDGIVFFDNTLKYYAEKVIAIEDDLGAVSTLFMSVIRKIALRKGYEIITCPCAISPKRKIDHIIIPSEKLAFVTTNRYFALKDIYTKIIHSNRFRDKQLLINFKERTNFNLKASSELLYCAGDLIKDAKSVHDLIEKHYIKAMDFQRLKEKETAVIQEIINYR